MDLIPDLRLLALDTSAELERLARQFPEGEPGRSWLRRTARRLRNSYARSRVQQKYLLLKAIADGYRRISDFTDVLGFSRREVSEMLDELAAAGFVTEEIAAPASGRGPGGRPGQWFELTEKAEKAMGF